MVKIEQPITGYKVVTGETPQVEPVERMHEKLERPEVLLGSTYKVKTPLSDHALYITMNDIVLNQGTEHEVRQPFEVFINSKNMDHFQWIVALTRVMSAVFRKGGDIAFLVDELKAVFDPKGGYFKKGGKFMPSLVADIGEVIESHMKSIGLIKDEEMDEHRKRLLEEKRAEYRDAFASQQQAGAEAPSSDFPEGSALCAKCSVKAVIMLDGCMTCLNCGDSKCG